MAFFVRIFLFYFIILFKEYNKLFITRETKIERKSKEEQFLCSLSKLIVFIRGGFFNVPLNDRLVYRLFGFVLI